MFETGVLRKQKHLAKPSLHLSHHQVGVQVRTFLNWALDGDE
jgi:hypothetical protein